MTADQPGRGVELVVAAVVGERPFNGAGRQQVVGAGAAAGAPMGMITGRVGGAVEDVVWAQVGVFAIRAMDRAVCRPRRKRP